MASLGVREDGESAVALAVLMDDRAAIARHALANDGIVACQGPLHRVGVLLPEWDALLDVGEQERQGRRSGDRRPARWGIQVVSECQGCLGRHPRLAVHLGSIIACRLLHGAAPAPSQRVKVMTTVIFTNYHSGGRITSDDNLGNGARHPPTSTCSQVSYVVQTMTLTPFEAQHIGDDPPRLGLPVSPRRLDSLVIQVAPQGGYVVEFTYRG